MAMNPYGQLAGTQAAGSGSWWTQNAPQMISSGTPYLDPNDPRISGGAVGRTVGPSDQPPPTQQPAPQAPPPSSGPAGIDPKLLQIYQSGGLTPAGRGSGFADWQYWQDKPSQWGRLTADIAGTGTDNPEGTPGQGAWSSSGGGGGGNFGGAGGAGYTSGNFGGPPSLYTPPTFNAPSPYQAPTFVAPSGLTMENDPGYQARLKMGTDALQASAAAKGSLLSGGTQKALDRYTQDYASNEYANVYGRAANTFGMNANLGLQGYGLNAANDRWAQENNANYGLQGYQTNVNTQRGAQQDYWQRLRDLYSGGLNATGQLYQTSPA